MRAAYHRARRVERRAWRPRFDRGGAAARSEAPEAQRRTFARSLTVARGEAANPAARR